MTAPVRKTRLKKSWHPREKRPDPAEKPKQASTAKDGAPFGIDPSMVDPRRILASIAADEDAPASARVAAAKALLASSGPEAPKGDAPDELSRRALEKLAANARPN